VPRVTEKLRRAKLFYGDVIAEFCLPVQIPVIDLSDPLLHNEALSLPSAELWRQTEEAKIKSLNGNYVLLPTRLPVEQHLIHTKRICTMKHVTEGNIIKRKSGVQLLWDFGKRLV